MVTLLLFHGWSGSNGNFWAWRPALEPRFRIVAPDLPGCAGVPVLSERHSADAYARWALALLDQLGIAHAVVGGLCSGSAIALALADRAPDRVDALLLHTPFLGPDFIRPLVRAQLRLVSSPLGALYAPLRRSTTLATLHRRIFADAANVAEEQLAHDQDDLVRADARAARDLAEDLLTVDRLGTVRRWRKPLAVLLAEADAFIDAPRTASALSMVVPHAHVERFAGGHGWTPEFVAAQDAALRRICAHLAADGR